MRLSASDKLRTLLAAKIGGQRVYTQKALAEMLGISTRTLRRVKNEPGHTLASATVTRIKAPLDKENRDFRRAISGKAWNPKTGKLEKSARFKLPTLPVQPVPTIYKAKSGRSQTLNVDTEVWNVNEKAAYLASALKSGRFVAWTARVKVPIGVATSGDVESTDVNEGDSAMYYMIGPKSLQSFTGERGEYAIRKEIEKELRYHQDAGREIVNISIVENLPE
jgi:hypothetical protein